MPKNLNGFTISKVEKGQDETREAEGRRLDAPVLARANQSIVVLLLASGIGEPNCFGSERSSKASK